MKISSKDMKVGHLYNLGPSLGIVLFLYKEIDKLTPGQFKFWSYYFKHGSKMFNTGRSNIEEL